MNGQLCPTLDTRTQEASMTRNTRRALVACATTAAMLLVPAVAQADVIQDWNVIAQNETVLLRPSAHGQSRGTAMVEGAVYDAVNAIDRGHQPYLLDLDEVGAQPWVSQDAAAATAAYRVLKAITPATRHAGLDASYATTLGGIPDGPIEAGGVAAGEAAAAAMLASRQDDGFMAAFNPVIGTGPGDWRPLGWPATPAFDPDGWVSNEKPFLIKDPSRYRSKGPNELTSKKYARDFNEVKELGALNSSTRTADQTAAAVFWQAAPAPLWNTLLRSLANRYHLDTADQARLYGAVNLAAADAAIACWNDKYYWQFWRPRAAIREADTDGNPATVADPSWEPLFSASHGDDPTAHHAGVPRPSVGPRLRERSRPRDDRELLRHRQGRDHRRLAPLAQRRPDPATALRPALGRARRGRRGADLGRDPLPHRRRAGHGDRQEGREVHPQALLQAAPLPLNRDRSDEGRPATCGPSLRSGVLCRGAWPS